MGTGKLAGIFGSTNVNALGPPVDVPMTTMSTRLGLVGIFEFADASPLSRFTASPVLMVSAIGGVVQDQAILYLDDTPNRRYHQNWGRGKT